MSRSNRIRRAAPPEYARELVGCTPDHTPTVRLPSPDYPAHWGKGALLNVRNAGSDYVVTLYPEEYDSQHPERAKRFANSYELQGFVSDWYLKPNTDPRARG